jgi:hypothetical protein
MTLAVIAATAFATAATAKPVTLPAETNLRAAPGIKSEILTLMPKGSEINVGDCDAGWCKVKFGDKEGFAIGRNLGEAPPQPAAPPQADARANMQKLRRGYEQYFDNDPQNDVTGSVDEPATSDQLRTAQSRPRRYAPPPTARPYYDDEDDYYVDDDDDGPRTAYVPMGPPVYYRYGPYPHAYYGRPVPYYYRRW